MLEALEQLADWVSNGIYDFFIGLIAYVVQLLAYLYLKYSSMMLSVAWDVGKTILEQLSVQTYMQEFISQFNNQLVEWIAYVRGFDAITLILNAKITKYLLRIVGL